MAKKKNDDSRSTNSPQLSDTAKLMIKGSAYIFLTSIVLRAILGIKSFIIAIFLDVGEVGVFGIIYSLNQIFLYIGAFGMAAAAIRLIAEYRVVEPERVKVVIATFFWSFFIISLPVFIIYFLSAPFLSKYIYDEPRYVIFIQISAISLFISILITFFSSVFHGFKKIVIIAKINFLMGVVSVSSAILFVYSYGLIGVFIGRVVFVVIVLSLLCFFFRQYLIERYNDLKYFDSKMLKVLLTFAIPALIAELLVLMGNWYGITVLYREVAQELGQTIAEDKTGLFSFSKAISDLIYTIPMAIIAPFIPVVIETYNVNRRKFKNILYKTLRYIALIVFPLTILVAIFFSDVIVLISPLKKFEDSAPLVVVVMGYTIIMSYQLIITYLFYVTNSLRPLIVLSVIWFVSFFCLAHLLIPPYSEMGLVWAIFFTWAINVSMSLFLLYDRFFEMRLLKYSVVVLIIAYLIVGIGFVGYNSPFPVKIVLSIIALIGYYVISLEYVVSDDDVQFFKNMMNNIKGKVGL